MLVAFEDDYGPLFAVKARDVPVELQLCASDGVQVAKAKRNFDGILFTNLKQIASGATLKSSGKVFVRQLEPLEDLSFFGIFSQGLDVFSMGHALPDVPSVPTCPTPTPPPPPPTPTCGNGILETNAGEECDGSQFKGGKGTCEQLVLGVGPSPRLCAGAISCTADCRIAGRASCDCPCRSNGNCSVVIPCEEVVPRCQLPGHCEAGVCVDDPDDFARRIEVCRTRCGAQ